MERVTAGEQWVQTRVAAARPAFERGDEGLAFASIEDYETSLRAQVATFLASVDQYLGMTLEEAQETAWANSDHLCVHPSAHRLYLSARRVHVKVKEGTVVGAYRDTPGWLEKVRPEPRW